MRTLQSRNLRFKGCQHLVSFPSSLPFQKTAVSGQRLNSWTPTEADGPVTNIVSVRVFDNGTPSLSVTQSFQIVVTEVNVAPVLAAVGNKTATEGVLLAFTATATDSDLPTNTLAFTLDASAPAGAAITPGGAFIWTPTGSQGGSNYLVTVRVTDNGSPALDDFETISIMVNKMSIIPITLTPSFVNNQFRLSFPSQDGKLYDVLSATNLTTSDWQLQSTLPGTGETLIYTNTANESLRFFRVLIH